MARIEVGIPIISSTSISEPSLNCVGVRVGGCSDKILTTTILLKYYWKWR